MKKKFLIIANGKILSPERLQTSFAKFTSHQLSNQNFSIICADGGISNAKLLSLEPDYLIGDLDSISHSDRELLEINPSNKTTIIYDPDQSKTDTRLAIELALKLDSESIYIIGATGGRMDHCISNILELKFINNLVPVQLIDEYSNITYSQNSIELKGTIGETLSLIPLSDIKELSYEGLEYPLLKADIEAGTSLICNKFSENQARITFKIGEILIIRAHD